MSECDFRQERRSGPGGQHRNKVETAVVVTHRPTSIQAEANERRSREDNRRNAIFRLRLRLAVEFRSLPAGPVDPSPLWKTRCRRGRIEVSPKHIDFPALLAELLDQLHVCDYDLPNVAQRFSTSASQLVKLLRRHPPAIEKVNQWRNAHGRHKLT